MSVRHAWPTAWPRWEWGPTDHVGVFMYSRPEYLETMVASYKIRAVPINVNYRYVADELVYLFDNADLVALVLEASFAPVVAAILDRLPRLRHLILVDDGSDGGSPLPAAMPYEDLLAANSPVLDFPALGRATTPTSPTPGARRASPRVSSGVKRTSSSPP